MNDEEIAAGRRAWRRFLLAMALLALSCVAGLTWLLWFGAVNHV